MQGKPDLLKLGDSKEFINACLSCEKSECNNCLRYGVPNTKKNPQKGYHGILHLIDAKKFVEMYNQNISCYRADELLGISKDTYMVRIRELGIESSTRKKRPIINVDFLKSQPANIKRHYLF